MLCLASGGSTWPDFLVAVLKARKKEKVGKQVPRIAATHLRTQRTRGYYVKFRKDKRFVRQAPVPIKSSSVRSSYFPHSALFPFRPSLTDHPSPTTVCICVGRPPCVSLRTHAKRSRTDIHKTLPTAWNRSFTSCPNPQRLSSFPRSPILFSPVARRRLSCDVRHA